MGGVLLEFERVGFRYPGSQWRLADVSLVVPSGEVVGIIGPNGSGKTTLLRLGAGVLSPESGRVRLAGQDVRGLSRRHIARLLGYLPQQVTSEFDYQVEEVVAMGRFPHLRGAGFLGARDLAVVERCLDASEVAGLRRRRLSRLSGGERQRALLASVLAQEPRVLLLDEPTMALDLHHQRRFFALVRRLAADGIAVVVVTHDVNLASLYCDSLALLREGRLAHRGRPEEVLTPEVLRATYGEEVVLERHPECGRPIVLPRSSEN